VPKAFFRGRNTGGRYLTIKTRLISWELNNHDWMLKDFDKKRWKFPRANLALKSEEFP